MLSFSMMTQVTSAQRARAHGEAMMKRCREAMGNFTWGELENWISVTKKNSDMGLSENVGYIPNEIAIFHRDNE